jgi:dienelactone hydrolase
MIAPGKLAAAFALLSLLAGCGGTADMIGGGLATRAIAGGAAHASEETGSFSDASPSGALQIPFALLKPAGDGPFPAVVIVHDCSGLGRRSSGSPRRWASKLVAQGYVVIIPDSFTPRGFPDGVCTNNKAQAASPFVRAGDARAALAWLRTQAYVDGAHIGLMGGSHGGSTTLAAMFERPADTAPAPPAGFAAAIALYPGCGVSYGSWRVTRRGGPGSPLSLSGVYKPVAPLLILVGEKDDWTPAAPCQSLAEAAQRAGYPVSVKIYPDALHSFDSNSRIAYNAERNNPNKPEGRGATTGGNPEAWADAEKEVAAFFGKHLKGAD